MRLWHCIIISILAHGALLFAPIAASLNRQMPHSGELRFVVLEDMDRNNAQARQEPVARQASHSEETPAISEPAAHEPPTRTAMDRSEEPAREERKDDGVRVEKTDESPTARKQVSNPDDAVKKPLAPQAPRQTDHNEESPAISEPVAKKPPAKTAERSDKPTREELKEAKTPVAKTVKTAAVRKRSPNPDDKAKKPPTPQTPPQVKKPKKRVAKTSGRKKKQKTHPVRSVRPQTHEQARQPADNKTGSHPRQTEDGKAQSASAGHLSRTTQGKSTSGKPREVRFGSKDGPTFRNRALPKYPMAAKRMGKEGAVHLRLTIDRHGHLTKVEVIDKAGWGFDEEAVRAVKHSTFRPARINGQPVTSIAHLKIRFQLRSAK